MRKILVLILLGCFRCRDAADRRPMPVRASITTIIITITSTISRPDRGFDLATVIGQLIDQGGPSLAAFFILELSALLRAFDFNTIFLKQPDRLGIRDLLLLKNSMSQRIGRIVFKHRANPVKNDRARIVGLVDEMNGASAYLAVLIDDRLMHAPAEHSLAAEIRQ